MRFPMKLVGVKEPTSSLKQFLKAAFHLQRKDALETRLGEVTSQGKQFQLNVISGLFWDFFFQMVLFFRCDFFRTALFLEKLLLHTSSEQLLRHNNYFFGAAISSELLLSLRSFLFQNSHLFGAVIFLEQLIFQKTST